MSERLKPWPTKAEAVGVVRDALSSPWGMHDGITVKDLVADTANGWPMMRVMTASQVRRAIGWLYGRGYLKVVQVRDGEPAWALTDDARTMG